MAEVGIILPLLTLVTFSIVDFASIFYAYLSMQNGVAAATRFAVTGRQLSNPLNNATLSRSDSIKLAMRQATPGVKINDSDFAFYNVTTGASDTGGPEDIIRVTVTHDWPLLTPVLRPFFTGGSVRLIVSSTMKNEPFPTS